MSEVWQTLMIWYWDWEILMVMLGNERKVYKEGKE